MKVRTLSAVLGLAVRPTVVEQEAPMVTAATMKTGFLWVLCAASVLAFAAGGPVGADDVPEVAVGSRVRVRCVQTPDAPIVGTLSRIENGTIEITLPNGRDRQFQVSEIGRLDVVTGQRSRLKKGLWIGGGIGLALMGGLLATDNCWGCADPRAWVFGIGVPAALGGAIGAASHEDRWEAVLPARLGDVGSGPQPQIALRLRF